MCTIENLIVRLIAGNEDYSQLKIRTYDRLMVAPHSLHTNIYFYHCNYEKSGQPKRLVALTQLCQLGGLCVVCAAAVSAEDKVVLSHNYGHGANAIANGGAEVTIYTIVEKHYYYSIIHAGCNARHRAASDSFKSLALGDKLKAMTLDIPQHGPYCRWFAISDTLKRYCDPAVWKFITGVAQTQVGFVDL